jgi:hypothetical protein
MRSGRLRNWWQLWAVAGLAVAAAWLLYLLFRSRSRDDLATYGAFALPTAILVAGWLAWAWRKGRVGSVASKPRVEVLDDAADQLAAAVQGQWKLAAEERGLTGANPIIVTWGRPSKTIAGPMTAAAESHRFAPLPGLAETRKTDLVSGDTRNLHGLYGGLRSGRLIIAGPAGSGKTGAAVLLVLGALRHREQISGEQRPQVPVPLLITAHDWNPHHKPAADWLTQKLQITYPWLAASTAAALLASGRITVILDGLDEISRELRPVAVQALSQQATFRLVILSRTSEMADTASSQGVLQGAAAIELRPVIPGSAASYLERTQLCPAPAGWRELIAHIRAHPDSPLCKALNNPLTLTLVRDTYQGENIRELLEFTHTGIQCVPVALQAEAITDHLLDRVLPAAYTGQPGQPLPYDLKTAHQALTMIATRMNQDGTRDLNWWQIPAWAPRRPRIAVTAIAVGLVVGLGVGVVFGLPDLRHPSGPGSQLAADLVFGIVFGLGFGTPAGLAISGGNRPRILGDIRLGKALTRKNLTGGLAVGVLAGLIFGFSFGVAFRQTYGIVFGIVFMLSFGLGPVLFGVLTADPDSSGTLTAATSYVRNRRYGRVVGLICGLGSGLVLGFGFGVANAPAVGLGFGLGWGLGFGVAVGLASAVSYLVSLASVQLAIEWHTPVRLMRFLDDAHNRNVLRAAGPSYQFRHARLQDRLAAAANLLGSVAPVPAVNVRCPHTELCRRRKGPHLGGCKRPNGLMPARSLHCVPRVPS